MTRICINLYFIALCTLFFIYKAFKSIMFSCLIVLLVMDAEQFIGVGSPSVYVFLLLVHE